MIPLRKPTPLAMAARQYCVPLIFAEQLADGSIFSTGGTALLLETDSARFLVTAEHVWSELVERSKAAEGRMTIMISNGQRYLSVTDATIVDESDDVVVLRSDRLTGGNLVKNLFYRPAEWPIPALREGETVGITGFPGDYRTVKNYDLNPGSWHIECPCVVGSAGRYLIPGINLGGERESVLHVESPPPLEDIGGTSGAPVFAWRDGRAVLVGIVTDGTQGAGVQSTIWISPLVGLNRDGRLTGR
jgi:hypothetical protein